MRSEHEEIVYPMCGTGSIRVDDLRVRAAGFCPVAKEGAAEASNGFQAGGGCARRRLTREQ